MKGEGVYVRECTYMYGCDMSGSGYEYEYELLKYICVRYGMMSGELKQIETAMV